MHYYEFNIGDYMRDTAHLDEMEDLAYRRMLDLYYLKESPLPKSIPEIAKLIRMRTHSESIANVLREYFTLNDDGYVNSKANDTLIKIYDKSEKAKKSAEKRWELQRLKNANALPTDSERNANGMLPNNLIPNNLTTQSIVDSVESPASVSKKKKTKPSAFDDIKMTFQERAFNVFWKEVERKKAGKADALKAFLELTDGFDDDKTDFALNVVCHWYDLYLREDESRLLPENRKYLKGAGAWMREKPWQADKLAYAEFKKNYYGVTDESGNTN